MLNQITQKAADDELRIVECKDVATGQQVDVLCFVSKKGGLTPVAKVFGSLDEAVAAVTPPEGYNAPTDQVLH